MNLNVKKLIESKVSLAPMAGITDYVLRGLVRKYSPRALLTTEMISSEYLRQMPGGTILKSDESQHPISYQISGHKPELMAQAAKFLADRADIIDINMGCPVNKVVKGQDGAALMRNVPLAKEIVSAVKENTTCPVSVKFRLGYTQDEMNFVEFGQAMQESGAEFITIHARTRAQLYSGTADWKKIKDLVSNIDIPVFANGDIKSVESAILCLEQSHAQGVAVGRAAMGDPTLIGRIEHYFKTGEILPPPNISDRVAILKKHIDEEILLRREDVAIKFMRKFYPFYLSGFEHAKQLRVKIITEENYSVIMNALDEALKSSTIVL